MDHFQSHFSRLPNRWFVVPLLCKPGLGESRSQALHQFLSFERSLHANKQFQEFREVINDTGHTEPVLLSDLDLPQESVYYLPMHAVRKETSTTTKVRTIFNASAKSSSGISLNDTLLVGPTMHSDLFDVLLHFCMHQADEDKDLHCFVWRGSLQDLVKDCRMTHVSFGVSASSFITNMCVYTRTLLTMH